MTPLLTRPEQLRALLRVPFSEAQLEAAAAPLEPGVIVAGAGSGKTTVMAARVVWLVGSGQVRPEEVLGLTFTNKAAGELAARIRSASREAARGAGSGQDAAAADLVPGAAPDGEPTVSTYHAFAGRLLQEHGLRLGIEPQARLLADASRYQLAAQALRRARGPIRSLSKPLRMLVNDLVALDGELSEHLVDPSQLRAADRRLLEELEALPKRTQEVNKVAEAARVRLELCKIVEDYRAAKRARDAIDFGDQVAFGARLAEECPEVGAVERARFRVVLLDEYQDTSVAQRRMLAGLFAVGHAVTAVGDPCQAIYGWRGASVANLEDFPHHFAQADGSPARRYSLAENRRSGSRLLELANAVAEKLRAVHDVAPLSSCAERSGAGQAVCALLATSAEEAQWVAEQVRVAIDEGTPPGEVAVLVRARVDLPALHAALVERGVPVEVVGLGGLLSLPEVADLVAMLQVIDDPTSNAALVRLLTGPRWRIGPRDLVLLGRRAGDLVRPPDADQSRSGGTGAGKDRARFPGQADPGGDQALREAVAGVDPAETVALADALERPGALPYSPEARERFAAFAAELADLRRHVGEPLLDLVSRVLTGTGLDVELSASPAALAARRRESVSAFLDHAARFVDLDGEASVSAFLAFLAAAEEYDRGLDNTAPSGADTVKLLTAHKAKGLEWDVVVVPGLTASVFPSGQTRDRWTSNGHVLPYDLRGDTDSLPVVPEWSGKGLQAFKEALRENAELEERRLGYVAFTRARTRLVASGSWWGPTQKKPRGPSVFLEEVSRSCRAGNGRVDIWVEEPPGDENPQLAVTAAHVWPRSLEETAAAARASVAAAVLTEMSSSPEAGTTTGGGAGPAPGAGHRLDELPPAERALVATWDRDADILLDELRRDGARSAEVTLPASLSTTQLLRLAEDPAGLARELARPMPRPPRRSARLGTRFHSWVETQFDQRPLLEPEELPGAGDADISGDEDLAALQAAFAGSPLAARRPYVIEAPFSLLLGRQVIRGRIDAVYETGEGWDVVDWKTGQQHTADPLQLAVYRLAWAEMRNVPLERVGAAFLYVRSGQLVRPPDLPGRAALEQLLAGPG